MTNDEMFVRAMVVWLIVVLAAGVIGDLVIVANMIWGNG